MNILHKRSMVRLLGFVLFMVLVLGSGLSAYAAVDEREPNDSASQANTIKIGDTIYGSAGEYNRDWFKFTAPVSGTVNISLWCDDADVVSRDVHPVAVDVYDNNLNDVAYTVKSTSSFGVISGKTYYVRARNDRRYAYSDYHFKLSYSIGKTTIKSVTKKKKGFTVKWNKKSKASFYQVQYVSKSAYQDYNWNKAKTVKVSNKYGSKTIKKLKKKKPYYVRVRVARTIAGKTYYSAWSPKKSVKTK